MGFPIAVFQITGNWTRVEGFLDSEEAGICELLIDPEQPQIPKAISVKQEGGIKSIPVFEDLYPFLSRDEFERITLK